MKLIWCCPDNPIPPLFSPFCLSVFALLVYLLSLHVKRSQPSTIIERERASALIPLHDNAKGSFTAIPWSVEPRAADPDTMKAVPLKQSLMGVLTVLIHGGFSITRS